MRRSNVRIGVTYLMAILYSAAAITLIVWLLSKSKWEEAIAIFTSVGTLAGGVIGYWFGNRRRPSRRRTENNVASWIAR